MAVTGSEGSSGGSGPSALCPRCRAQVPPRRLVGFADGRGKSPWVVIGEFTSAGVTEWAVVLDPQELLCPWQLVAKGSRCETGVWVRPVKGTWSVILLAPGMPLRGSRVVICDEVRSSGALAWPLCRWLFSALELKGDDELWDRSGRVGPAWEWWRGQTA